MILVEYLYDGNILIFTGECITYVSDKNDARPPPTLGITHLLPSPTSVGQIVESPKEQPCIKNFL